MGSFDDEVEIEINTQNMPGAKASEQPRSQSYNVNYKTQNPSANFFDQFDDEDEYNEELTNTPKTSLDSLGEHFYSGYMMQADYQPGGILGIEAGRRYHEYKGGPVAAHRFMQQYQAERTEWESVDWFFNEPSWSTAVAGLAGGVGGAVTATALDPTSWIALPFKLFSYANWMKQPVNAMIDKAISYGSTNAAFDVAAQGAKQELGQQEGMNWWQTAIAGGLGAGLGGTIGFFGNRGHASRENYFDRFDGEEPLALKEADIVPTKDMAGASTKDAIEAVGDIPTKIPENEAVMASYGPSALPEHFYDAAGVDKQTFKSLSEDAQIEISKLWQKYEKVEKVKRPTDVVDFIRSMGGKQVEDFEAIEARALQENNKEALASFFEARVQEKYPEFALHADEMNDAARLYAAGARDADEMIEQIAMLDLGPASKAVDVDDGILFSMKKGGRPKRTQPELIEGGKITLKEYLDGRANGKLGPTKPQEGKESLGGLFGDDAKQTDLLDQIRKTADNDIKARGAVSQAAETYRIIAGREFDQRPPRLPEIIAYFKALANDDTGFMKGRFPQRFKHAQGIYNMRTGSIRMKSAEDLGTMIHEMAHSLENNIKLGPLIRQLYNQHAHEIGPLDYFPERGMLEEGFAEFMRMYVETPAVLFQRAPKFLADFEVMLKTEDPRRMEILKDGRAMWAAYQANAGDYTKPSRAMKSGPLDAGTLKDFNQSIKEVGFFGAFDLYAAKIYRATLDRNHFLNRAVTKLVRNYNIRAADKGLPIMDLKAADNPYILARLAADGAQAAQVDLMHGTVPYRQHAPVGPSVHDALNIAMMGKSKKEWNEDALDDFGEYLAARTIVARYVQDFNTGKTPRPPHSRSEAYWRNRAHHLQQQNPQFKKAAAMIYSFEAHQLRKKYDAGLKDDELFAKLSEKQDYVPLQRDMTEFGIDDKFPGIGGSTAKLNKKSITRRAIGSDKDFLNPIENIMREAYITNSRIAQNEIHKKLADLAYKSGPGGASIMERIPEKELKRLGIIDVNEVIRSAAKEGHVDPRDAKALADYAETILGPDAKGPIYRQVDITEGKDRIVYVWRNGYREAWRIADTEFAGEVFDSLTALGNDAANAIVRTFAVASGIFRAGITTEPSFLFSNFIRDQLSAWILSDVGFIPVWSGAKGAAREVSGSDYARDHSMRGGMAGGANTAAFDSKRIGDLEIRNLRNKGWAVQRLQSFKDFMKFIEVSETGTRLGLYELHYKKGLKDGLTPFEAQIEAAFQARDYIDFGRHGSHMNNVRKIATFMNAAMQGLDKGIRTLVKPHFKRIQKHPLTATEQREMANATRGAFKLMATGMFGLYLEWQFADNQWYQDANPYFHKSHWVLPYGEGKIAVIPKPFELGLVSTAFQDAFRAAYHNDPTAKWRFMEAFFENTIPPMDNPLYKTWKEVNHNYNEFTKRRIVEDRDARQVPSEQWNEYTSELAKTVTGGINKINREFGLDEQSPMYVDHWIRGLGGSWGRQALTWTDQLAGKSGGAEGLVDAFIFRRFLKDASRGTNSTQKFWDAVASVDGRFSQIAKTYKDAIDGKNDVDPVEFLERYDKEEVAYARLNGHFSASIKRIHPLRRAQDAAGEISKLRRQLRAGEIRPVEGDDGEKYPIAPDTAQTLDMIMSKLQATEILNAMSTAKMKGFGHLPLADTRDYWEQIREVSPEIYEELRARYEEEKVYSEIGVREAWPEAQRRLMVDGPEADLEDLVYDAQEGDDPGDLD